MVVVICKQNGETVRWSAALPTAQARQLANLWRYLWPHYEVMECPCVHRS
jgi:hypothetical protein